MGSPSGGRRTIIKTFIILLLLFLVVCQFSCTNVHQEAANLIIPQFKVARKLANLDVVLDYHDPTPNPAHDPGKGRPAVAKTALNP